MVGEYIPSNQGTTRDIYGSVRSSAVDGRSPYVTSNYGTVDTLQLRDGRQLRVSAVDGESPYIVTRSNPGLGPNLNSGLASAAGILFGVPLALVIGGYMGYRSGKSGK